MNSKYILQILLKVSLLILISCGKDKIKTSLNGANFDPSVDYISRPNFLHTSTTSNFNFTTTPKGATIECKIDSETFTNCTNGKYSKVLPDGPHTFYLKITTKGGKSDEFTYNYSQDSVPPLTPTVTLTSSSATTSSLVTMTSSNCTDIEKILISESGSIPNTNDSNWQKCNTVSDGTTHTLSTDGNYTLRVWSKDDHNNISAVPHVETINFDSTAPSISITSPTGGSTISGANDVVIYYSITDDNLTPNSVNFEYSLDSGTNWSTIATGQPYISPYIWTAPGLNNTNLRIRISAEDDFSQTTTTSINSDIAIDSISPPAPVTTLTSSDFTNSTSVTFTLSNCSDISHVLVKDTSGAPLPGDSAWQTCSLTDNAITYSLASIDDTYTLRVWSKDTAGNVSSTSSDTIVTLDTTAPSLSVTTPTDGSMNSGINDISITYTASDTNIETSPMSFYYSTDSGANWNQIETDQLNSSPYLWINPGLNSETVRIRVTATDRAGNVTTVDSTSDLTIDSTSPTLTSSGMIINGGTATTGTNTVQVSLQGSDNLTNVTHFCLKSLLSAETPTAPTSSDSCWVSVDASPSPALTPSSNLTLSNFYFQLGINPGEFSVYTWLKDAADNISSLTSSGLGTLAQDKATITYAPSDPPTLVDIIATDSDSPVDPYSVTELTVAAGDDIYIKWNATDDFALPASPVSLYYTTDDVNYNLIASNLTNGQNGSCTVDNPATTADDNSTGCYLWSSGAPASTYFKIRVAVTDTAGQTTFYASTGLNTSPLQILAGNTEAGLGASAKAGVFFPNIYAGSYNDKYSFAIATDDTIYLRDKSRGILRVDPSTGNVDVYIADNDSISGDGGPATSATVSSPLAINIDGQNRLYIYDEDVIRRVEVDGTINTIIGGGSETSSSISGGLNASLTPWGSMQISTKKSFNVLPNGDLIFDTLGGSGSNIISYFDESTGTIVSTQITGTGTASNPSFDLTSAAQSSFFNYASLYDPDTSIITGSIVSVANSESSLNTSNISTAPHPAATGIYSYYTKSGKDGKVYVYSKSSGYVKKYDETTQSWSIVLGTGKRGYCPDGTEAIFCDVEVYDLFVTRNSRIYFIDAGSLRVIDENGDVQTVAFQALGFGDGQNSLSARFGELFNLAIWNDATNDKVIVFDRSIIRFKEFNIGGNLSTIAGDGSTAAPVDGDTALSTGLNLSTGGQYVDQFVSDSSGSLFTGMGASNSVVKLNRSTGLWEHITGNSSGTYYFSADGLTGENIRYRYSPKVLGYDGSNVVVGSSYQTAGTGLINPMLKLNTVSDGTQSHLAGSVATGGYSYSPSGTALISSVVPSTYHEQYILPVVYDSYSTPTRYITARGSDTNTRFVILDVNNSGSENLVDLVTLTGTAISAFDYRHDASNNVIYYCNSNDNKLYKYDLSSSTNTALTWSIDGMACTGVGLKYSSDRDSIIFTFKQNGLYGVAEYLSP